VFSHWAKLLSQYVDVTQFQDHTLGDDNRLVTFPPQKFARHSVDVIDEGN
jgi:hypothetical protein